jgi:alpha-beta hydrolase superfamily lysophospholipase
MENNFFSIPTSELRLNHMKPTRVFIHGLESSSRGTKGTFFRKHYSDMIIEDYLGSFSQRMEKLDDLLDNKHCPILVGSSFGGLMAAVYAHLHEERVGKLILLAPALHLEFYKPYRDKKLRIPTTIFHGSEDNVVPREDVRVIAGKVFLNHEFNIVQDDHSLHNTFPSIAWDSLLNLPD